MLMPADMLMRASMSATPFRRPPRAAIADALPPRALPLLRREFAPARAAAMLVTDDTRHGRQRKR